jgi:hypothetical protein
MAIALNGTTGISGVDGSASAPALQGTDSNTGINFASDTVNINTGGSTRATVNSSGKLGIGTTSPVGKLTVDENNASEHFQLRNTTNTSNFSAFGVDTSFNLRFYVNGSNERLRIDSSGKVGVGITSLVAKFSVSENANLVEPMRIDDTNNTDANRHRISFRTGNSEVGKIVADRSSTTYTTSSDYRLKENEVAISDGITRLKTLKPYRFNFKIKPENIVDGFFAHEVQQYQKQ